MAKELFGEMTIEQFIEFNRRKATEEEKERIRKFWEKYKQKMHKFASHRKTK